MADAGGPTLSVVMPNYNHARYVGEALEAVASQSFRPKEVVVVDDASTDGSVAVIERAAAGRPFVRLLRNERNLGAIPSVLRGFAEITGDYVAFLAADDRVLPGFFEKSMRLLARHPQAGVCSGLARYIGPAGEDLGPYRSALVSRTERFIPPEECLPTLRRWGYWIVPFTAIFKRAAVIEAGGYDPELGPAADAVMMLTIPARHGACFIPEELALWRKLDTSYAVSHAADVPKALALIGKIESRLRGAGVPPDVAGDWKRTALAVTLYENARAGAPAPELVRRVLGDMPAPGAPERLLAAAQGLPAGARRAALRAYLFWRQKPADRRSILARKLGLEDA